MIPKVLAAIISGALLAAVVWALPSEASSTGQQDKAKARKHAVASSPSQSGNLNSPSTDFSNVTPSLDDPHADLNAPKRDKNSFFDQTPN